MGQYYYIVNLDKKEFIHPHLFNDGLKLLEFGCSSQGTMTALAVLCADGNGKGGGDICRSITGKTKIKSCEKISYSWEHSGKQTHLVVPKIAGRWSGDRIVIAGDYAEPGSHMTQRDRLKYRREILAMLPKGYASPSYLKHYSREEAEKNLKEAVRQTRDKGVNLYEVCAYGLFDDISLLALEGICCDSYIRESFVETFARGMSFGRDCPKSLRRDVKKYVTEKANIIKGKFVSDWGGILIYSDATLNLKTGFVETKPVEIEGLDSLDREYFEVGPDQACVGGVETTICPACHEYILTFDSLFEVSGCSNSECESLQSV